MKILVTAIVILAILFPVIEEINPVQSIFRNITQTNQPKLEVEELSSAGPMIYEVTTNVSSYPDGVVAQYAKFEITFQVDTSAENLQLPFDENPPSGVQPGVGITVDALFTPDNWQTIYTQPAFYYQGFEDQVKSGREWFYPNGDFSWKVRFSPDQSGVWQYKLTARDSSGYQETQPETFTVGNFDNKGFLRVSQEDQRYFEFENGDYFPGMGYNMNFNHISWDNPTLDNLENFQVMSENGIQLVRIWLSQWGIYDASWGHWNAIDPELHGQYIPYSGLVFEETYPGSDVSMRINTENNPCMFLGFMKAPPAVKRNTTYRIRIRYMTKDITGPRQSGYPFGFVAKTGGWLWGNGEDCYEPATGNPVTPYQPENTTEWLILEGSLTTGDSDFLPYFYLTLENVNTGKAYIDYVWIEEDLGSGSYGPNIVSKSWMNQHYYMDQRNSYAFDKVLQLAEQYSIYLRPVILEKNSWIFNRIDFEGNPIPYDPACYDSDPNNDPAECPGNEWFYGNWRTETKVRWLHQAWWRYLQARWGYSTSIHSWELLNEGDPFNSQHYTMADEFAKYMHQFKPNQHLVSTSTWHSFPKDDFWSNSEYSNIDFADVHRYIPQSDPVFNDAAQASYVISMQYGALQAGGAGKPVIRGETGFVVEGSEPPTDLFDGDTEGIWLHNFIWGSINPGGLIESYWYENSHIYRTNPDGSIQFDHRQHYGVFSDFIQDIPLNNGEYEDIAAQVFTDSLRVWGQKDLAHRRAHLWVQNTSHTWRNIVDGLDIQPASGDIMIAGFQPGANITVEWWNTYPTEITGGVVRREDRTVTEDGTITLQIEELTSDLAIKIYPLLQLDQHLFLPHISFQ